MLPCFACNLLPDGAALFSWRSSLAKSRLQTRSHKKAVTDRRHEIPWLLAIAHQNMHHAGGFQFIRKLSLSLWTDCSEYIASRIDRDRLIRTGQ